ncbi:calcium-activated chloride channel-domain-containing protein [Cladochytrium replicatum]|nr:calcium-activated chloride channel-domain-containing protein [Cladochytrium replicatum]
MSRKPITSALFGSKSRRPSSAQSAASDGTGFRHPSFDFEQAARTYQAEVLAQERERAAMPRPAPAKFSTTVSTALLAAATEAAFRAGLTEVENNLIEVRTLLNVRGPGVSGEQPIRVGPELVEELDGGITRTPSILLFHKRSMARDLALFDQINAWKLSNPSGTLSEALTRFAAEHMHGDAICKILYENSTTHHDAILRFEIAQDKFNADVYRDAQKFASITHPDPGHTNLDASQLSSAIKAIASHSKQLVHRSRFLIEATEQCLFIQIERDLSKTVQDSEAGKDKFLESAAGPVPYRAVPGSYFVKIVAPFEVLGKEAERVKLHMPLKRDRARRIRAKMDQFAESSPTTQSPTALVAASSLKPKLAHIAQTVANESATSSSQSVAQSGDGVVIMMEEGNHDQHKDLKKRRGTDITHKSSSSLSRLLPGKNHIKPYVEGPSGTVPGNFDYMFTRVTGFLEFDNKAFVRSKITEFRNGTGDPEDLADETDWDPRITNRVAFVQLRLFSNTRRNMLTQIMVYRLKFQGYKPNDPIAGITNLLTDETFTSFYAIHDGPLRNSPQETVGTAQNARSWLYNQWTAVPFTFKKVLGYQPLRQVRDYYGEKVGFYFAWLGFYALWCQFAALLGIACVLYGIYEATHLRPEEARSSEVGYIIFFRVFDNAATLPFAIFISLWATLFLEFWKRETQILRYVWDLSDMKLEETLRGEWFGTSKRVSPITGRIEPYVPIFHRILTFAFTGTLMFLSVLLIIFFQAMIVVFNAWSKRLENKYIPMLGTAALSLANILLLQPVYLKIAKWLNDVENYKTATAYENALNVKNFILTFINNYASIFYLGLVKAWLVLGKGGVWNPSGGFFSVECGYVPSLNGTSAGTCLSEVTAQVAITFVGLQFVYQLTEVIIPFTMNLYTAYSKKKKVRPGSRTPVQRDDENPPQYIADDALQTYSMEGDFKSKVVQFGFVALFSCSFPLAPVFALINNLTEIRIDAFKLVYIYRRPFGLRAVDIGLWENILHGIARFGILTNALLIAFGSRWFNEWVISTFRASDKLAIQLGFVVVFEYLVLFLNWIIVTAIPDTPKVIRQSIKRDQYLTALENNEIKEHHSVMDEVELRKWNLFGM